MACYLISLFLFVFFLLFTLCFDNIESILMAKTESAIMGEVGVIIVTGLCIGHCSEDIRLVSLGQILKPLSFYPSQKTVWPNAGQTRAVHDSRVRVASFQDVSAVACLICHSGGMDPVGYWDYYEWA